MAINAYSDRKDQVLVSAIITMAQSLGMAVVAEGVETQSQYQLLKQQSCDISQGYLCSPPVAAEQAFNLMRTGKAEKLVAELSP